MNSNQSASIVECFSELSDPRMERTKHHSLIEIIVIAICAVISGADGFVQIEEFGNASIAWLRTFLDLKNGIPSHDTFGRVFSLLDPEEFRRCFMKWIQKVAQIVGGEIVPIDGKTLRRSYDKHSNRAAIHMVSAWADENGLVLGQIKVDDKSNEITAIPELLKLLEIRGCIVTTDAMGCQRKIAEEIANKEADYILALKGNQGNLHEEVNDFFERAWEIDFKNIEHEHYVTENKGHGREEIREYILINDVDWLSMKDEWAKLNSIGMVISTRIIDEIATMEVRYYISSLKKGVKKFAKGVRSHWGIENKLHWVLDVQLREDDSRIRKANAPENFSLLRHMALNLLRQERSLKRGIGTKRLKAALDPNFRERILFGN